jgi:valyl-tRNA synthetase
VFAGQDEAAAAETRATTAWTLDEILKLLHPFMPFITEELWRVTAEQRPQGRTGLLAGAAWPQHVDLLDAAAEAEIGWIIELVDEIRSLRAQMNLTVATALPVVLVGASDVTAARVERWGEVIKRLARLASLELADVVPPSAAQLIVRGELVALPLAGIVNFAVERARLEKEMARAAADIAHTEAKLSNPRFIESARKKDDGSIEAEQDKRDEAEARRVKISEALERLAQAETVRTG